MDIRDYMKKENEKPLDNIVTNGGFCGIFRKIACIGDSLASGEMESFENGVPGYHDYFDRSWGQFLARDAGVEVYNFSRGGMTAKQYCEEFAEIQDFWSDEYRAQAYIIALGVNDITQVIKNNFEFGSIEDINLDNCENNKPTFVGFYAKIIQRYQKIMPKAKFFLMTMPKAKVDAKRVELIDKHCELLYKLLDVFENCYVMDFYKYAPEYDNEFRRNFYLGGHLNFTGYRLTALMVESYIDYIIRNNPEDFKQVGFIGTPYHNSNEKW